MKRRILAGLLVCMMLLSLMPTAAFAVEAEGSTEEPTITEEQMVAEETAVTEESMVTEELEATKESESTESAEEIAELQESSEDENPNIVYVTSEGNDTNGVGTEESPFATIGKAINKNEKANAITILVSGSVDWGTPDKWNGQSVTITGKNSATVTLPASFSGNLKLDNIAISNTTGDIHAGGYTFETTDSVYVTNYKTGEYISSLVLYADGGSLILRGGSFSDVFGGSDTKEIESETNDITIIIGENAHVLHVYGGGNKKSVSVPDIYITLEEGAVIPITSDEKRSTGICGGSLGDKSAQFVDTADIHITVDGYVEGCGYSGSGNEYDAATGIIGGTVNGNLTGNVEIKVGDKGIVRSVIGGCTGYKNNMSYSGYATYGNLTGNVTIVVDGKVETYFHEAANVLETSYTQGGYIFGGGLRGYVTGNTSVTLGENGSAYAVFGGSYDAGVTGNTDVKILGNMIYDEDKRAAGVGATRLSGDVFGGSYLWINTGGARAKVKDKTLQDFGNTNVYIGSSAVVEGAVYGGGASVNVTGNTKVTIEGAVNEAYGGAYSDLYQGWFYSDSVEYRYSFVFGDATLILRGNAEVTTAYAGGKLSEIGGDATIILTGNSEANNVYGGGKAYNAYYWIGDYRSEMHNATEIAVTAGRSWIPYIYGDTLVHVLENAKVTDTIYGYSTVKYQLDENGSQKTDEYGCPLIVYPEDTYEGNYGIERGTEGTATVLFDGNSGSFKRVVNADLMRVTNSSDTTLDNARQDNEQLVNVTDLTIDDEGKLHLLADARISGDYSGDEGQTGTLLINAGKCLTADGEVTDLTKISIIKTDNTDAAAGQVYVISGEGSTTKNGNFKWIDERNQVIMAWKKNSDGKSQWWLVPAITIEPVSITSYVGGTSVSGNATPTLRWLVTLPDSVDLETTDGGAPKISALTMVMHTTNGNGSETTIEMHPHLVEDSNPDSNDHTYYYYFPTLESGLSFDTDNDLEGNFLTLTDVSAVKGRAGRYSISLVEEPEWYITATIGEQTYSVVVNIPDDVQITTRYVSSEDTMYDSPSSMLTKVVTTSDEVDTSAGKAVAVIPENATFYTNGYDSGLGLVGATADTGYGEDGAKSLIALLFDDTVTLVNTNDDELENKKLEELMITHAGHASEYGGTTDYSFEGWKYDFRYLDLVNVNDGNAWVSCDKDITIYWPYPDGVTSSGYEFQLLHYKYMDRDVDYGISLVGNVTDWTEQFMHGGADGVNATEVEEIEVTATDKGLMFTLEADASGNNMSPFVLMWKTKNSGGNTSGGGTTYYTLHYESNGGTEYDDERYAAGTVVSLDKVPTREGYVFTGWYADEALTEKITSIKMTGSKAVYAGWRASTVPDMLNGDDHFAYVIGYTDGTVRPDANISRAETATIFFRLLTAEVRDGNLTSANTFEDVTEGMWCNQPISTMAALGIVKGRSAEMFDPDAPITRAEFAAICARFDTGLTDGNSNFSDISGHWAEAEIKRAASLGWIMGYTDGTFRPDQYITRAEAMTIINRVLCRIPEDESDLLDGMNVWPDNDPGEWYYLAVQEATNSHEYVHKGEIYETWVELTEGPDWNRYEN